MRHGVSQAQAEVPRNPQRIGGQHSAEELSKIGRKGGKKGGKARALALSAARRKEIARMGSAARVAKKKAAADGT